MPAEITVGEALAGACAMYDSENGPDAFLGLPMPSQLHLAFVFCVGVEAAGLRAFTMPRERDQ